MPPKGYRTLTVRVDVLELLSRAKSLFHKSQIQILHEAISEYINRRYEYGSTILPHDVNATIAAWSAGVFDTDGVASRQAPPPDDVAVEVSTVEQEILAGLKDIWGGTIHQRQVKREDERNTDLWIWELRDQKAERFLQSIVPYLRGPKIALVKKILDNKEA